MATRKVRSHIRQNLIRRDAAVREELRRVILDVGQDSTVEHKAVISDWEHKPDFQTIYFIYPELISMSTKARGKNKHIWKYVNEGTRPHQIRAVNFAFLSYRKGYSPKTAAPAKAHTGTGEATGEWGKAQVVNHPGSEAREFTKTILDKLSKDFSTNVERAIRRGIRRG